MIMPAGRKKVAVSKLFNDVSNSEAKVPRVQCKVCQTTVAKNGTRMKNLQRNVSYVQSRLKTNTFPLIQMKMTVKKKIKLPIGYLIFLEILSNHFQNKESGAQITLENFADKMSKQEQVYLNALLVRSIYASGAPFCIVKNKHWLAFFKALRAACVVPSRYLVLEPLLVSEYHQTRLAALAKVAEVDAVTVMCDGWNNIRHEPIINFTLSVSQSVFWKSTHTELESHTGECIAEKVSEVIQEV